MSVAYLFVRSLPSLPFGFAIPFITVVLLAACERDTYPRSDAPRDSAGISIFQLRGEGDAPTAELDSEIPLQVEGTAGEVFLYLVRAARQLDDGRVAVVNGGTRQILVFDSAGRNVAVIGREGSGPGEYRQLSSAVPVGGDTIAALDSQLRRITVVTAAGLVVRDFAIPVPDGAAAAGLAEVVGILENGGLLIWVRTMPKSDAELAAWNTPYTVVQVPSLLFSLGSSGKTAAIIGEFPGEDGVIGILLGTSYLSNWGPAPFGHWTRFGAHNGSAYVIRNAEQDIRVYAPDGKLRSIYRSGWAARTVTSEDRRRFTEEWVNRYPKMNSAEERRTAFGRVPFPQTMPAYRDAIVGSDGVVWIEPNKNWDGERRLYIGYDATGAAIGKLAIAYAERILDIGNGRVILLGKSADAVETIRLQRFRFNAPEVRHDRRSSEKPSAEQFGL